MTPISLLEELLLLTLEDGGGEFDRVPELQLACGVAGATLLDLALRGRVDSDLQALWVVDPTPTGDPILDGVLAEIAASAERLSARSWTKRLAIRSSSLRAQALQQLCERGILRVQAAGFRNLWTPFAEFYHHESASRGADDTEEKRERFRHETETMLARWGRELAADPAYNPNLTLELTDFSLAALPRTWKPWQIGEGRLE